MILSYILTVIYLIITLSFASNLLLTPHNPLSLPVPVLTSRDTPPESHNETSTPLNKNGTLNLPAWNTLTRTHCEQVLYRLPRATNPTGTAVCYNLPTLDTDKGDFTADLRLYSVSVPRDDWRDVDLDRVDLSVDYPGADVETVSADGGNGGRLDGTKGGVAARYVSEGGRRAMLRVYMLKGRVHADKMRSNMSASDLQALLIPQITITSPSTDRDSSHPNMTVHPSTNEAIFLTGVFAGLVIQSPDETELSPSVKYIHADKLPGRTLALFPTGLVVTGSWTLIGALVVGVTVWEKRKFRGMYRRDLKTEARLRRLTSMR